VKGGDQDLARESGSREQGSCELKGPVQVGSSVQKLISASLLERDGCPVRRQQSETVSLNATLDRQQKVQPNRITYVASRVSQQTQWWPLDPKATIGERR
jgi:hypothetical protein